METRAGDGPKQGKRQGTATPPNPAAFPGGMPLTGMPGAEALSAGTLTAILLALAALVAVGGFAYRLYRSDTRSSVTTPQPGQPIFGRDKGKH